MCGILAMGLCFSMTGCGKGEKDFSDYDKSFLAGSMHKLYNMCGYRFENARTKTEHEEFINNLSEKNFDSVGKQVEMYVFARNLYGEGYR